MHNLAAYSGNRVVMVVDPDPNLEYDLFPPIVNVLDFDPRRVADIARLSNDQAARETLETQLAADGARVRVVTRRYNVNGSYDEDDEEYPYPETNPLWDQHLRDDYLEAVARHAEEIDPPALEFDEPPVEHRDEELFGFIESRVQLPEDLDLYDDRCLAITASALIHIPTRGTTRDHDWFILYMED